MKILISKGGEQTGPFTVQEVETQLHEKTISRDDHAWWEGLQDWVNVDVIPGIRMVQASQSTPIQITAQHLAPIKTITLWRPRLPLGLELLSLGLVDPVFQTLNWITLSNGGQARRSAIWMLGMVLAFVVLIVLVSADLHRRESWLLAWPLVLVAWHSLQGRKQIALLKTQPRGTVKYRSTQPFAALVMLILVGCWVGGYFSFQKKVVEETAKKIVNRALNSADADRLECVEVRLGAKISEKLYKAEAVIDNGESVPLTVKVEGDSLSAARIKGTLPAYLGWARSVVLDDQVSVRLNERQFLESYRGLK